MHTAFALISKKQLTVMGLLFVCILSSIIHFTKQCDPDPKKLIVAELQKRVYVSIYKEEYRLYMSIIMRLIDIYHVKRTL